MEVSYPSEALERKQDQRGYQFRIDASGRTGEAERKNTAFGFEPSEEMLLSRSPTQKLRLPNSGGEEDEHKEHCLTLKSGEEIAQSVPLPSHTEEDAPYWRIEQGDFRVL